MIFRGLDKRERQGYLLALSGSTLHNHFQSEALIWGRSRVVDNVVSWYDTKQKSLFLSDSHTTYDTHTHIKIPDS